MTFEKSILLSTLWLILCTTNMLSAQTALKGRLQNARTGAPLIYAHVGVLGTSNLGTISDDQGYFQLTTKTALSPDQIIQCSAVGYATRQIQVAQIQADSIIKLEPSSLDLPEVTVSDRRRDQLKTRGHYGKSQKMVTGWSHGACRGGVRAARIKLPNRAPDAILRQLRFHLAYNEYDSVLFRIHFYHPDASGQLPGEQIPLRQELFVHHDNTVGDVVVDLTPRQILVNQDFFVGIEVVRTYGRCATSDCLHFSVVLFKDRIYSRNTVTDTWGSNKLGSPAVEVDMLY